MAAAQAGLAPAHAQSVQTIEAGPAASIADITSFQGSLSAAGARGPLAPDALAPALKGMFTQLEKVNGEARQVSAYAKAAEAKGVAMTPGDILGLTVRCQEFMFHCQLTSNIANRTSDGLQQLFRQQS
ncbi:hypothetical protein HL653_21065 [Sphingomonas sp. AP4-R1]|nr:hypothetical protein HL653_21065 [Sphingomonas sp. AP4-R1]